MTAIGGREVVIATDEGIAVIKKQLIVDPESGTILAVENTKIAVPVGDGNIVVREQQRIQGVRRIPSATPRSIQRGPPSRRALAPHNIHDSPPQRSTRREWKGVILLKLCLLPCFIPCVYSRKWMVALQLVVFACVFIGIIIVGIGPIHSCAGGLYISASVVILVIFGLILCLSLACCCFACHTDNGKIMETKPPGANGRNCQICWLCIAWLFGMMFCVLVILETLLVFPIFDQSGTSNTMSINYSSSLQHNLTGSVGDENGSCKFGESLIGGLCFSYTLIIFFSSYWWVYCIIKNSGY